MNTDISFEPATKLDNESARSRLSRDLQGVVAVTGVLLKDAASATGDGIASAGEQVKEKLHVAAAKLVEKRSEAVQRAQVTADITQKYVQTNPWKALGISALIGLSIGIFLKRN